MFPVIERPVIKICGIQSVEAAAKAVEEGANLVGVICVPNRKRTVDAHVAKQISQLVRASRAAKSDTNAGPYLVGVFRNQSVEEVVRIVQEYGIDIVQLHGSEEWQSYQSRLPGLPLIKRFLFPKDCNEVLGLGNGDCMPLFDSEAGGTGEKLDWQSISEWSVGSAEKPEFILAGGLTPCNVGEAVKLAGVIGVDVSGGVETQGSKDLTKIGLFVANAAAGKVEEI